MKGEKKCKNTDITVTSQIWDFAHFFYETNKLANIQATVC